MLKLYEFPDGDMYAAEAAEEATVMYCADNGVDRSDVVPAVVEDMTQKIEVDDGIERTYAEELASFNTPGYFGTTAEFPD